MRNLTFGWIGIFLLAFSLPVLAQTKPAGEGTPWSGGGGRVKGRVRDARTNQPVSGVRVEILATDSGATVGRASVGNDGQFEVSVNLKRAVIVASAAGYHPARVTVDLAFGGGQSVFLAMQPKKPRSSPGVPPSDNLTMDIGSLSVPAEAHEEYREAVKMLGEKDKQTEAIKHLKKAVELYPEYVEAHHLLGTIHLDQGKRKEADEYLGKTLELNGKYAPAYVAMGVLRNQEKEYAEAEKMLKKGLALDPTSWQGHLELAKCHFFLGRIQDAEAHGLRAHELNGTGSEIHMILSDIFLRRGYLEKTREEYEHFLALEPEHPMAGRIKQQIGKIDEILKKQAKQQ
jgi:Flp pilus assembly protein TadD